MAASTRSPLEDAKILGLAVAGLAALRLPFLPATLEDIDSVNFDLGVHDFYPFAYQPHPPGYAVFIAIAKLVHPLFDTHAAALAFPSAVFGALAVVPIYLLLRQLIGRMSAGVAAAFVVFNPVFWINSVRPMSDVTGFTFGVAAQYLLVLALTRFSDDRGRQRIAWLGGALCAGLAVGVRVQAGLLVAPVLIVGLVRLRPLRVQTIGVLVLTCAVWLVPTIVYSGGLERFLSKQAQVVGEALPSEPLVMGFSAARAARAAVDTFVRPWGSFALATLMLAAAALGAVRLAVRAPGTFGRLLLLFGPYALYHYTLQNTVALRYTLPMLPLVAALAAVGLAWCLGQRARLSGVAVVALASMAAWVTLPALKIYAGQPSPPAQAVQYLQALAARSSGLVVAGHHMFHRYLPELAPIAEIVQTLPNEEWRALNRYWVRGEQRPIWFLRDPQRSTLRLVDPAAQTHIAAWRVADPVARLIQGARPTEIELVRLDPPRWFVENGVYVPPAEPARAADAPHVIFVRPDRHAQDVELAGIADREVAVDVAVGDGPRQPRAVQQAFSIRASVPSRRPLDPPYIPIRIFAGAPVRFTELSLTSEGRERLQMVRGFYQIEREGQSGTYRWMAPRAEAVVVRSGAPVRLRLRGRVPVDRLEFPLTIQVNADGTTLTTHEVQGEDVVVEVELGEAEAGSTTALTFIASQSFVPHSVEHNGDTRELALRVYDLAVERLTPGLGARR